MMFVMCRTCKRFYFLSWEPELWVNLSLTSPTLETDRAIKVYLMLSFVIDSLFYESIKIVKGSLRLKN